MNIYKILLPVVLILSCSAISRADSVVISFEGGKTQTIPLDSPIKSITAVQYLTASEQTPEVPQANTATPVHPQGTKQTQQQPEPKKPMFKFKWAEPITGQ